MVKLSIIIPYFNTMELTYELLDCLAPQIRDDMEVIVIDDGSPEPFVSGYTWCKVVRYENGGLAKTRNRGIEISSGEHISFIDSDDLVSDTFVNDVFEKMPFDLLELSWKTFGGYEAGCKLNSEADRLFNPSACTRVFGRSYIGDTRFNEKKDSTEDEDFSIRLGYMKYQDGVVRKVITKYSYLYRTSDPNSMSRRYLKGLCNTKRVCYYFNHVTAQMTYLVDEIKREDEYNEVFLMTNQCDIPELSRWCQVIKPQQLSGHILRGEPTNLLSQIAYPIKTQVVIWTHKTFEIGGIETFIYEFCKSLHDYYDIIVLYDDMDIRQIRRIEPYCQVLKNDKNREIYCDTIIVNRICDSIPPNVYADRKIQMCHTCKQNSAFRIPQDKDQIICVSNASKDSFPVEAKDAIVIHNVYEKPQSRNPLFLLSATRLDTGDKGQERMLKLAKELNDKHIPYFWIYFANVKLENAPKNMICAEPTLDIVDFMSKADFLVQLSSSESFCYSIVEALSAGTPVICTDLPVLPEIGVIDGVNAHVLPMDMNVTYDVEKIQNNRLKGFDYEYNNGELVEKWRSVLGNTTPTHNYNPIIYPDVRVKVLVEYVDILLNKLLKPNEELTMAKDRALYLQNVKHFVRIIE